tara:strand:+ start:403 stop:633 length:231 start_codon:yes stop_codon:yes gene_type:complete
MALSEQVKDSLEDAKGSLKNALAFSARNEKPMISKHIADMLANIDNLIMASNIMDKIENRKEGDSGSFGSFFNGLD